ncbi:MAG: polysulfide reductase NrfD [candidate division Zixibacteria bacterium]|nr:polysulfide reductase NrfD [candidate division Zixibacteria bacterium]
MLEKALYGDKKYWSLVFILSGFILLGLFFYLKQYHTGLTITGLGRDVSWGFYIAQLTFLVGVAASAVMVVLPYYLHDFKVFGKITILGEFLAISSVTMCMLFVVVDLGQPFRMLNMFLHPSLNSILFWDSVVLSVYLMLNLIIGWTMLGAERKGIAPPKWVKPIILLSIPWAISIHTVTAFLYCGLAARPFWMTAVLAPRFLASAFAAGPALLILFSFILKKYTKFDAGKEAVQKLAIIATYAMLANIFFILMEIFTAFYSNIPEHIDHFKFLFVGLQGNTILVPWMWASSILAIIAALLLVIPKSRNNTTTLGIACVAVFVSIWIDKGLGMIVAGFTPSPLHVVADYWPTWPELFISLGIYGIGFLMVAGLYKIALSVRGEV